MGYMPLVEPPDSTVFSTLCTWLHGNMTENVFVGIHVYEKDYFDRLLVTCNIHHGCEDCSINVQLGGKPIYYCIF
jgi:hypothetical protein